MTPHWLAESEEDFEEVQLANKRMMDNAKFP